MDTADTQTTMTVDVTFTVAIPADGNLFRAVKAAEHAAAALELAMGAYLGGHVDVDEDMVIVNYVNPEDV